MSDHVAVVFVSVLLLVGAMTVGCLLRAAYNFHKIARKLEHLQKLYDKRW